MEGTVSFGYQALNGDTLPHGDWRFKLTQKDPTVPSLVHGIEIGGRFEHGIRNGEWLYSAKELHVDDSPQLKGFQVVKNTSGSEHQVVASFKAGKASGDWRMVEQRIADGQAVDTLQRVKAHFTDGRLDGTVSGRMGPVSFQAAFNRQGLAHGNWQFEHWIAADVIIIEQRSYVAGQLRGHQFMSGGGQALVDHVGTTISTDATPHEMADVELSTGALRLLTITGRASALGAHSAGRLEDLMDDSNAALLDALKALVEDDGRSLWERPTGSDAPALGMLRLPVFPFSKEEESARYRLSASAKEVNDLLNRFFSDPLADLGRHAYEDLEAYHAVMEVYRERMDALRDVLAVIDDPMCVHLDRNSFLPARTPVIDYPDRVTFRFKDAELERTHAFPKPLLPEGLNVMLLEEHLGSMLKDLKDIRRKVDTILDRYKTGSQLVDKEERLVLKRDSVLALYANAAGRDDFNAYHERLAAGLKQLVIAQFREYAGLELDGKVERIESLLACYNEAIDTYHKQLRTPLRIEQLNDTYTRNIWNPHTFTYMDERIKERIYRAYETALLPRVFQEMEDHVECGKLMRKQMNMVKLYQRMLELRDMDTRAMERQLRRGMDAEEVMRILELELDLD